MFGPSDLARSYGVGADVSAPVVEDAITRAGAIVHAAGVKIWRAAFDRAAVRRQVRFRGLMDAPGKVMFQRVIGFAKGDRETRSCRLRPSGGTADIAALRFVPRPAFA
jgi:hypothetical protein